MKYTLLKYLDAAHAAKMANSHLLDELKFEMDAIKADVTDLRLLHSEVADLKALVGFLQAAISPSAPVADLKHTPSKSPLLGTKKLSTTIKYSAKLATPKPRQDRFGPPVRLKLEGLEGALETPESQNANKWSVANTKIPVLNSLAAAARSKRIRAQIHASACIENLDSPASAARAATGSTSRKVDKFDFDVDNLSRQSPLSDTARNPKKTEKDSAVLHEEVTVDTISRSLSSRDTEPAGYLI